MLYAHLGNLYILCQSFKVSLQMFINCMSTYLLYPTYSLEHFIHTLLNVSCFFSEVYELQIKVFVVRHIFTWAMFTYIVERLRSFCKDSWTVYQGICYIPHTHLCKVYIHSRTFALFLLGFMNCISRYLLYSTYSLGQCMHALLNVRGVFSRRTPLTQVC
jgi:hypothetical protein